MASTKPGMHLTAKATSELFKILTAINIRNSLYWTSYIMECSLLISKELALGKHEKHGQDVRKGYDLCLSVTQGIWAGQIRGCAELTTTSPLLEIGESLEIQDLKVKWINTFTLNLSHTHREEG